MGESAPRRIAVVLFNLGGPDGPQAVRPFLFNLFNDPAIIALPSWARGLLAWLIAARRTKSAQANYARLGGASPLLAETEAQASALAGAMRRLRPDATVQCFVAMRYWTPMTEQTAAQVTAFAPDEVILLPLYPQYSATTTGSSLAAWRKAYRGPGRVRTLCCYPTLEGLIEAHADRIQGAWTAAGRPEPVRLLFSAHGLPQKCVEAGDPYQSQIEATAAALAARLGDGWADWRVCYQSRVGPLKWLGPSTLEAIGEAVADGLGVVIAPIAFVSEHVETLVELDHDYALKAQAMGCETYVRAPALGVQEAFIEALARMAAQRIDDGPAVGPGSGFRCAQPWSSAPCMRRRRAEEDERMLMEHFNLVCGLHIVAVIAWMSGLLYLPRLFAYHTRAQPGSQMDETFQVMERKLLRIIINPAMILVFILGLTLGWLDLHRLGPHFWLEPWALTKIGGIVFLSAWHGFLARARRRFAAGENQRSERFWRMTNELPFLAAIVIVLSVTTKFGT